MQPMRDIMMEYRMLANRRFGIYRKINFAINLAEYVKDFDSYKLAKDIMEKGYNLNLPLIAINKICDAVYDPNIRIRVRRKNRYTKIPLLMIEEELLNIEQIADRIVLKHRAELDSFITSAEADIL